MSNAREVSVLKEQIRLLERLLKDERKRSDELLTRLIGPVPTGYAGPMLEESINAPEQPDEVPWTWAGLQPQDEAVSDVREMVKTKQMSEEEAKAVLESLGFENTEVEALITD